jgi:hypothetical protein
MAAGVFPPPPSSPWSRAAVLIVLETAILLALTALRELDRLEVARAVRRPGYAIWSASARRG